jgi:iron complex outermembrane receptor protein
MRYRNLLLAAASFGGIAVATAAYAQPAAPEGDIEAVVVTGTRAARSRLETLAPVDVIDNKSLARQGNGVELAQAMANLTPAINFPRPAITDGSDHVRPATLRGLAPDQTLVLINGMRGHVSAVVNVNGGIGRGSTSFDLNTIPSAALGSVEVLRDGASAQYGADAIAGVLNLRLREARSGGSITANWGIYNTEVDPARGPKRKAHDGLTEGVSGWIGLPLGAEGFLTLSGEAAFRHATNRSDVAAVAAIPAVNGEKVIGRFGDPDLKTGAIYANAGLPLNDTWSAYAFGGYQKRQSDSAATPRPFSDARNVQAIYPAGFTPVIGADIEDYNLAGGVKGDVSGWGLDFNVGYGRNTIDYTVKNSLNATYGAASPTRFAAGGLTYDQLTAAAHADKEFELGLFEPLNVALGVEYRREEFGMSAGEPKSYDRLATAPSTIAGGSQGFPGFRPANAGSFSRHNWSAYVDVEGKVTEGLSLGAAARFEDYSDFGQKTTGKLSARYDFTPAFALRGSISSGFKAPALQQQFFSYTATNNVTSVVNGQTVTSLVESGKFRVTDAVAISLGAKPLKPETSMNYSLGGIFRANGLEVTVDAYQIKIKDRIALSENLGVAGPPAATVAAIQAILAPYGVSAAQFFLNGLETTTKGLDVVARYRVPYDALGRIDLTLAGNLNYTNVNKVPALPNLVGAPATLLFDRGNRLSYEKGTPEQKYVLSADWNRDALGATLKATSYDSVLIPNNNQAADYKTGSAVLLDFEGRYTFGRGPAEGVSVALGVNNLTDVYPNFVPAVNNAPSGAIGFPNYSPFGFNGRFLYGRVTYAW